MLGARLIAGFLLDLKPGEISALCVVFAEFLSFDKAKGPLILAVLCNPWEQQMHNQCFHFAVCVPTASLKIIESLNHRIV